MGMTNLEVGEIGLLVEGGLLETEGVDDVVNLRRTLLKRLLGLLSGGVGACMVEFSTLVLA